MTLIAKIQAMLCGSRISGCITRYVKAVTLSGVVFGIVAVNASGIDASELQTYASKFSVADLFPNADRLGEESGEPSAAPVYRGDDVVGYVFLNSAIVNATGYSGKPIHVVVGMNLDGIITGAKMVKHHEPIVLVGIPERKIDSFIDKYKGLDIAAMVRTGGNQPDVDVVSGATVTVMVIDDTIVRAAIKIARSRGLGGLKPNITAGRRDLVSLKKNPPVVQDWQEMLGDGSVRRLHLSVADVNAAFRRSGKAKAASLPESENAQAVFIDLYAASGDIPTVARSLLGEREYNNLLNAMKPGQSAILLAGDGLYSFKGSGYVRGGIFDRFQLIQDDINVRFRDKHHKRIGSFETDGAPPVKDVDLFIIPKDLGFDPARPWRIQLLVQRATGPIKKDFTTFDLGYIPPEKYLLRQASQPTVLAVESAPDEMTDENPLWRKIWLSKKLDIGILVSALGVLTLIFFFQDWLVKRPVWAERVRATFLLFTVLWIGFYAQAQLSVVNALTFAGSLIHGFSWDFFLKEPLIFILWASVAASLLFWGRGVYCGWLCPFGALQELLNKVARLSRVPQYAVPWALHERAWPVKYILFLGLLGVSLYSFELAERLAEIEPFKTSIILKFVRTWPYVLFAITLLAIGLFIERFFCRYLCPLGGALGIPGRLRMNDWLRRHRECGSPCQRCARECMVQAIHPNGQINPNECLQCLHCQMLYYDGHRCPPMIQRRLRRERRLALSPGPGKKKEITEKAA